MFDIKRLYNDYNVQYWESGKNVSPGWINVQCPFCNDTSNHLGFSPQGNYVCWRCGSHGLRDVLKRVIGIHDDEFKQILRTYGNRSPHQRPDEQENAVKIGSRKFIYPSGTSEMSKSHVMYLERRLFDPGLLGREWRLLGTGPISFLDQIDFKHRIIAPILWDGMIVSFQARDYTNKSKLRYITCPKPREIIHHKHILYGDQSKWTQTGICVEGITDVWRFGGRSFATFGIEYTQAQVRQIVKHFSRVFVVFDYETQAQKQAEKLVAELRFHGIESYQIKVENDPGSMSQVDANKLVSELH